MSPGRFSSNDVKVWLVRRRRSRFFAQVTLALVVLALGWVASWLAGVPVAGLTSLGSSLRQKLSVRSVEVESGELRLSGEDGHVYPIEKVESARLRSAPRPGGRSLSPVTPPFARRKSVSTGGGTERRTTVRAPDVLRQRGWRPP